LPDLSTGELNKDVAGDFDVSFGDEQAGTGGLIAAETPSEAPPEKVAPFLVHKESGPLYPDLLVQLNTSELLDDTAFGSLNLPSAPSDERAEREFGTADLIDSLVSNIGTSFDVVSPAEIPLEQFEPAAPSLNGGGATDGGIPAALVLDSGCLEAESRPAEPAAAEQTVEARMRGDELQEIFEELRDHTGDLKPLIDFETHFSLGLAYKDMELLDEAIGEFQMAFRMAGMEDLTGDYIHCCNMLGVCFTRKQMPKVAIRWYERGLKIPNRPEDEYQALRYEIGLCYEEMGEIDKAIDAYMEVYGIDVSYRGVAERIAQLQSAKSA
jgi:tetratricopeptide (TPR) repeat protein